MTIPTFNPNAPKSECYGAPEAGIEVLSPKWYQNGWYYDGEGRPMRGNGKGQMVYVDEAEVDKTPSGPNGAQTSSGDQGALKAMPIARIKSIFKKAGGPMEQAAGAGAKNRMISWLMENAA